MLNLLLYYVHVLTLRTFHVKFGSGNTCVFSFVNFIRSPGLTELLLAYAYLQVGDMHRNIVLIDIVS